MDINIIQYVVENVSNVHEVGNIAPLIFTIGVVAVIFGNILKSFIK